MTSNLGPAFLRLTNKITDDLLDEDSPEEKHVGMVVNYLLARLAAEDKEVRELWDELLEIYESLIDR